MASTTKSGTSSNMVARRLPRDAMQSHPSHSAFSSKAHSDRVKPSVRQTIESIMSTGSQAEYFNPNQTIILFDWDDTLCPSNWIRENRPALSFFRPAPLEDRFQVPLRELQKQVESVLKLALKMGKVIIVTNAMEPWVETSCRNFLPHLLPILRTIPVIYARSVFDTHCIDPTRIRPRVSQGFGQRSSSPGPPVQAMFSQSRHNKLCATNVKLAAQTEALAPQRWKELAFEQEISGFYSQYSHQSWKNIISIGDSIFERDAVRRVVLNRPNMKKQCRTKTTKLLDEPEIEELIEEVQLILNALPLMVQHDGNLDIEIDEGDLKLDLSLVEKIMDR